MVIESHFVVKIKYDPNHVESQMDIPIDVAGGLVFPLKTFYESLTTISDINEEGKLNYSIAFYCIALNTKLECLAASGMWNNELCFIMKKNYLQRIGLIFTVKRHRGQLQYNEVNTVEQANNAYIQQQQRRLHLNNEMILASTPVYLQDVPEELRVNVYIVKWK